MYSLAEKWCVIFSRTMARVGFSLLVETPCVDCNCGLWSYSPGTDYNNTLNRWAAIWLTETSANPIAPVAFGYQDIVIYFWNEVFLSYIICFERYFKNTLLDCGSSFMWNYSLLIIRYRVNMLGKTNIWTIHNKYCPRYNKSIVKIYTLLSSVGGK